MRKVFTFVAAMCCMMFFSVSNVYAALADGAVIKIGGTTIDTGNKDNVTDGIITDGTVSYDDVKSVLTLNNVKISGNDTYGVISIDASSVSNDLTIQVVGECYVKGSRIAPLHVKGMSSGHKVIITGDKSATLKLEASGAADVSALLCAKSQTSTSESEFFPLMVTGGMTLILDNFQAGNSDDKPALMCLYYIFDKVNYMFKSYYDAGKAIHTATSNSSQNKHNNVQQIIYDETAPTEVYGYAYTKEFPVYVNGMQMTDGKPELGSTDVNFIKWGTISFDDATSTLTLDGIKIETTSSEALYIKDADPSREIKIVALNYSELVSGTSDGIRLLNPAVIDPNGIIDIDVTGDALYFVKDLTIESSGTGWLSAKSSTGKGIVGEGSNTLTIKATMVEAEGDQESFSNFNLNLQDAEMSGFTWNATYKSAMDGGSKVKGKKVLIKQTKWSYAVSAQPAAGGTIALQWKEQAEDEFADVTNPYMHEGKGYMKLQATANTGYEFVKWDGLTDMSHDTDNPYISTTELTGENFSISAMFARISKSDATKISVLDGSNQFFTYTTKFKGASEYGESVPLEANENLYAAIYANGKIYFSVYNNVTMKSAIFSAEFKDGALEARKAVLDFTADDSPIYTLAYNNADQCIYAISSEMSGQALLKVPTNGSAMSKVNNLASPVNVAATAFNSSNVLYLLEASTPAKLYTMSLSDASLTEIGELTGLNVMGNCAMLFTPDGELIAQLDKSPDPGVYLIDPSTATYDWLADNWIYAKGIFYNLPAPAPKSKITVKSSDDSKGTVSPAYTNKPMVQGKSFSVTATAKKFYKFGKWDDGNTDNPRTITVGTSDATYVAEFINDPDMKIYPIKIGGVALMTGATSIVYPNTDYPALQSGAVIYNPASNTLTLDNAQIDYSGSERALEIDNGSSKGGALTVVVKGAFKVSAVAGAMLLREFSSVTFVAGDAMAQLNLKGAQGIEVSSANLVINGLATNIQASTSGIVGTGEEKATIKGAAVEIGAATAGAFYNFSSIETEYCSVDGTHEIKDGQVNKGSSKATDKVTFKSWPKLTVKAAEGEGEFTLISRKKDGGTFTNVGWFEDGDEIEIKAEGDKNFTFFRWIDDSQWEDEEKRWDANRKRPNKEEPDLYKKTSSDQELQAIFFYEPKSSKTWYGISAKLSKVVQFELDDFGKEVKSATKPSVSTIKAGEFVGPDWWYLDGSKVKSLPFGGDFDDGDDLTKDMEIGDVAGATPAFTDMASNHLREYHYGIKGSELYQYNESAEPNPKYEKVGTLKDKNSNTISATAIAVDATGTIYLLVPGSEGMLYTVTKTEDEVVTVAPVGPEENGGRIGTAVAAGEQSMAFDHATGELFWGASDYMRIIDMTAMKTYAVADLKQTGGAQGYIKSLHCMDKAVRIFVEPNKTSWGKATIGTGDNNSGRFYQGSQVTIVATPKEGYHFVAWKRNDDVESKAKVYTFKVPSKNATYVAVFEEGPEEGIDNVQSDNVQRAKVLIDGQLYIIREGKVYNANGIRVK